MRHCPLMKFLKEDNKVTSKKQGYTLKYQNVGLLTCGRLKDNFEMAKSLKQPEEMFKYKSDFKVRFCIACTGQLYCVDCQLFH